MSDKLLWRLVKQVYESENNGELVEEAIVEIERLRARVEKLEKVRAATRFLINEDAGVDDPAEDGWWEWEKKLRSPARRPEGGQAMSDDAFIDHILSLKKQVSAYGQEVDRLCGEIAKRDAEITRLRDDRRERIATAFMGALLPQKGWDYLSPNHAAKDALRYADALINELDRVNELDREAKP